MQRLQPSLRIGQLITDQAVYGHMSTAEGKPTALYLQSASLAMLWMQLTLQPVSKGVNGAVGTLTSMAVGAGKTELVGVWLQVGLLCASASGLFVGALWLLTPAVLREYAYSDTASLLPHAVFIGAVEDFWTERMFFDGDLAGDAGFGGSWWKMPLSRSSTSLASSTISSGRCPGRASYAAMICRAVASSRSMPHMSNVSGRSS